MGPGVALLAAGAITAAGEIARGKWPTPTVFLGAAIAGGLLVGLSSASPELASHFGTLVLVTALIVSGTDVATGILRVLKVPTTKGATA